MSDSSEDQRISSLILLQSMYGKQCLKIDDKEVEEVIDREDYHYRSSSPITFQFLVDKDLKLFIALHSDQRVTTHCQISTYSSAVMKTLEEELNCESDLISLITKAVNRWEELKLNVNVINESGSVAEEVVNTCSRFWIYSHHIKNQKKRQMIIELSRELGLKGITCVGKPGFVMVEGRHVQCEDFWTRVRATNWQRITLIECERDISLVFNDYKEVENTNHFMRELEKNNCEKVVKKFLGFKTSEQLGDD